MVGCGGEILGAGSLLVGLVVAQQKHLASQYLGLDILA